MPSKKSKPVGEALAWTEADLDRMAEVTPEDLNAANAQFARQAPKKIKDLLKAKPARGRSSTRRNSQ